MSTRRSLHGIRTCKSVPVCQPVIYCIVCCVRLASCGVESSVLFVCSMCLLLAPRPKRHWVSWHWVSWHWGTCQAWMLNSAVHNTSLHIRTSSHELLRSVLMNCGSEVICKDHVTVSRCNVAVSHSTGHSAPWPPLFEMVFREWNTYVCMFVGTCMPDRHSYTPLPIHCTYHKDPHIAILGRYTCIQHPRPPDIHTHTYTHPYSHYPHTLTQQLSPTPTQAPTVH